MNRAIKIGKTHNLNNKTNRAIKIGKTHNLWTQGIKASHCINSSQYHTILPREKITNPRYFSFNCRCYYYNIYSFCNLFMGTFEFLIAAFYMIRYIKNNKTNRAIKIGKTHNLWTLGIKASRCINSLQYHTILPRERITNLRYFSFNCCFSIW